MKSHRFLNNKSIPVVSISDGEEPILSSFSSCEIVSVVNKFVTHVREKRLRIMETLQF